MTTALLITRARNAVAALEADTIDDPNLLDFVGVASRMLELYEERHLELVEDRKVMV